MINEKIVEEQYKEIQKNCLEQGIIVPFIIETIGKNTPNKLEELDLLELGYWNKKEDLEKQTNTRNQKINNKQEKIDFIIKEMEDFLDKNPKFNTLIQKN